VCGFFVIGLPGETRNERQETRDAVLDWGLDWAFFNYATPLRGSELFRLCKENNWIEEKHLPIGAIDMTDYVITAPGMDKDEIKQTMFDMNLDLNFVNNHNMRKGNLNTAYQAFREVVDRHPTQPFAQYFIGKCLQEMIARGEIETLESFGKADIPPQTALRGGAKRLMLTAGEIKVREHYKNYQQIIESSKTWHDAAEKFGLEMEPKYPMFSPESVMSAAG
jgi:hypothetical protein